MGARRSGGGAPGRALRSNGRKRPAGRRARPAGAPVSFPIVGVGASAGGLEAFTQLLQNLPADTGMAFVLIQHLDPGHTSFLGEAIAKASPMAVSEAHDRERVVPNHVYVIPSNADLELRRGRLWLRPRLTGSGVPHLPVDCFFRSLAAERGRQAIGVVLSGTASDGTEGLRAIKALNGITLAQDPRSAKFGGMPHSAVDAGVADYCLPLPQLAQELVRLSRHPYEVPGQAPPLPPAGDAALLARVFELVRREVGVDFSEYKAPTFERRLIRRMAVRKSESLAQYVALLEAEPQEARALYEDALIHVSSFFRDPEVFTALQTEAFPEILKQKVEGAPIRAWVAGCASGEEAYSLAIALLELLGDTERSHPIQIFGSDLSEKAIQKARQGIYPDTAIKDLSDDRRRSFFAKVDGGYRINKNVRDLCVFVRHDLGRDAPFSKLDLVSCRNVLIYFDQELQKRILPTFHYALNQPGYLLLGKTESISGFSRLFTLTDRRSKLFTRTAVHSTLQFAPRREVHPSAVQLGQRRWPELSERKLDVSRHVDRMLLTRYAPPGVLVTDRMEILQFRGETGAYLQPAPGEPSTNLMKMARGGLLAALRRAVSQAKRRGAPVRVEGVAVGGGGERGSTRWCNLVVLPFPSLPEMREPLFVVLFEDADGRDEAVAPAAGPARAHRVVPRLKEELSATRDYLSSLIEEHGRTNETLNAANEELVSGNEELQSMNEELETAKEELQSTNEELTTVNDELQSRNVEVNQVNGDLVNLLNTVESPIVIVDLERKIRRFTPKSRDLLNLLPSDVGRPLGDIRPNVDVTDLDQQVAGVIATMDEAESEIQDRAGRWSRMRLRPYKTVDYKIDGAIISLVDIDVLKHHVAYAELAQAAAEHANQAKDQFLATLSHELRSPLAAVLMQAQLLRRGGLDDARVARAGELIERGTRLQVRLIDDLLDVSRIVTGKLKMELALVDMAAVVRAALEEVVGQAERKGVRIKVALDEKIGMVAGDAVRLQQVVTNLLNNAIKFTPSPGEIQVELVRADHRYGRLVVTDTGEGIGPEFLRSIFSRFSQEDGSNSRSFGGLGLGLAIVRHIVEAHGGTVKAESQGKGRGATLSVMLPLITQRGGAAAHGERRVEDAESSQLHGMRILVVDDDAGTRDAVLLMLENAGAKVRSASSVAEAIHVFGEFHPQVLLADLAMPVEDGFSLIRKIRALRPREGGNVPSIALSALAGDEDRQRSLTSGFQLHLVKPVDTDHLARAVLDVVKATP